MRKDAVRSPLRALALAAILLLSVLPHAVAASLTEYKLGEATFTVPSDWKVTERRKNRGYTFESANGKMAFWAEWWLQDEPILGYADIVSHKTTIVDGRKATYVHSRTNDLNSFAAVFDQPRADGRKFLMHLESSSERQVTLATIFDSLLSQTTFADGDASRQKTAPPAAKSDETGVLELAAPPVVSAESAGIAFAAPAGWRTSRTERDSARIVTIASPDRLAVALLATFPAASDSEAGALIDDFKSLFYGDYVLPSEILGNGDRTVGGVGGTFVEMIGDTYLIEGVRISFSTGRSWFFEGVDGSTGYVTATVSAEKIPASDRQGLDAIIASVRFGDGAVSGKAIVEPSAGVAGDVAAPTLNDCDFGQSEWVQKARDVLKRHSGSRFLWAGVCRDGSQLIVGGEFPFDPNGATGVFFNPLYFDLLDAAGDQGFILAVPKDRVMIKVALISDSEVSIEFSEFPEAFRPEDGLDVTPGNATETESDTFGDAQTDIPAAPAEADLIRTAGMDDPALWLSPSESQKLVLFDGNDDTSRWTHYASSKSAFDLLARFEDGGFTAEVPA